MRCSASSTPSRRRHRRRWRALAAGDRARFDAILDADGAAVAPHLHRRPGPTSCRGPVLRKRVRRAGVVSSERGERREVDAAWLVSPLTSLRAFRRADPLALAGLGPRLSMSPCASGLRPLIALPAMFRCSGQIQAAAGPARGRRRGRRVGGCPRAHHPQKPMTRPRRGPTYVYAADTVWVSFLYFLQRDPLDVHPADDAEVASSYHPNESPASRMSRRCLRAEADCARVGVQGPATRDRPGHSDADQRRGQTDAESLRTAPLVIVPSGFVISAWPLRPVSKCS